MNLLSSIDMYKMGISSWRVLQTTLTNRHFAPVYLLGTTRLSFIRSTALEPFIYLILITDTIFKQEDIRN